MRQNPARPRRLTDKFHPTMQKSDHHTPDAFDLRILAHWQHDTRMPAESIGAAVGLSATAVQRRLKRMRECGIIAAEVALLAPGLLELPVTCIVGVDLEREGAAEIDQFKARMSACVEVQQCYYVTGPTDFVLVVLARSMEDYELFTRRMLLADPNVRSFTTNVVLDRVKVGMSVPIGTGEGMKPRQA